MIYAIILAGGKGERLWPLSSQGLPKQFHCIYSNSTMLQETIERIIPLIEPKNIYITVNKSYYKVLAKQLINFAIPKGNIFFELSPKNTLAPIGFISARILAKDREGIIVVLPSDHFIDNATKFIISIKSAIELAKKGLVVCMGTRPKRPDTGYGYIKVGKKLMSQQPAYKVERFLEKPDKNKAKKLIASKKYLWNCGMFIFKAQTMIDELRYYAKALYSNLKYSNNNEKIKETWNKLPLVSIDCGIMERTKKAAVVCINYKWYDIGNWLSFRDIFKKDRNGNLHKGEVVDFKSKNTTVLTDDRPVLTLGLNNVIIVNANNAILACSNDCVQDIKKMVQMIRR